jgi:hypothetical protein
MKSDQLKEGEDYALEVAGGEQAVRVTLTSLEARYASKVIVTPHHSKADAATGIEVPVARLVGGWDAYLASNMEMTSTAAFHDVLWIPKAEEIVELEGTGSLEWTVMEISFQDGEGWAVVRSEVFGRPQEQTVPITQLHRRVPEVMSAMELRAAFSDEGIAPLRWESDPEPAPVEPKRIKPVRNFQPETIAGRLVFSEAARVLYRKMGWCKRGQEQVKMRSEVRRRAFLGSTRGKRGFVVYVVPRRFEFGLDADPTTVEGDLWVDEIVDIRSEKAKAKFKAELDGRRAQHSRPPHGRNQRQNSGGTNPRKRNRRRRPSS